MGQKLAVGTGTGHQPGSGWDQNGWMNCLQGWKVPERLTVSESPDTGL